VIFDEDAPALHVVLDVVSGALERSHTTPRFFAATMILPGRK